MSRQQWLAVVGIWVMVFLKLGFPSAWDEPFAVCTGVLIIFISFKMRPRSFSKDAGDAASSPHSGHNQSTYVENGERH